MLGEQGRLALVISVLLPVPEPNLKIKIIIKLNNFVEKNIPPINGLDLKITNACNLRCIFCVNDDKPEKSGEINVEGAIAAIKKLIEQDKNIVSIENIFFTGGEPTLRLKSIAEITNALAKSIFFGINTNGLLLDEDKLDLLKKINVKRIKFSYDTTDKKLFTLLRRGTTEDDHEKLEKNIATAVRKGFLVFLRVALGKLNKDDLLNICKKADDLGVDTLQIKPIICSGRAKSNKGQLMLTEEEIFNLLQEVKDLTKNYKIKISISCFPPAAKIGLTTKFCANQDKFYFDINGNIYHCNYIVNENNLLGNYLKEGGVEEALNKRITNYRKIFSNERIVIDCPSNTITKK